MKTLEKHLKEPFRRTSTSDGCVEKVSLAVCIDFIDFIYDVLNSCVFGQAVALLIDPLAGFGMEKDAVWSLTEG